MTKSKKKSGKKNQKSKQAMCFLQLTSEVFVIIMTIFSFLVIRTITGLDQIHDHTYFFFKESSINTTTTPQGSGVQGTRELMFHQRLKRATLLAMGKQQSAEGRTQSWESVQHLSAGQLLLLRGLGSVSTNLSLLLKALSSIKIL